MNDSELKTASGSKHICTKVLCGCLAVFLITVLGYYISNDVNRGSGSKSGGISCVSDSKAEIKAGDHVYFGSYPHTADGTAQPIEWRVLDVEDGKALAISEYLLDVHIFDEYTDDWTESDIRAWLNGDFLNSAFNPLEREKITADVSDDLVSLLSMEEAKKHLKSANERKAAPTPFTMKRGAHISGNHTIENGMTAGWWWLRSSNPSSDRAPCISSGGFIMDHGSDVDFGLICVRPVILVSLSDEIQPVIP